MKHIKNPISLARLVMEKSPHVLMAGDGAEGFAKEMGMLFVDQKYFIRTNPLRDSVRWNHAEGNKVHVIHHSLAKLRDVIAVRLR